MFAFCVNALSSEIPNFRLRMPQTLVHSQDSVISEESIEHKSSSIFLEAEMAGMYQNHPVLGSLLSHVHTLFEFSQFSH